jgi:porin
MNCRATVLLFLAASGSPVRGGEPPSPAPQVQQTVETRAEWTQFLAAPVAGQGDRILRYGGRVDGFAKIDGERLGLWQGVSFQLHGEFVYGQNTNRVGTRLLLPVNAALSFPRSNDEAFDLSYSVIQRIGRVRIQAGKINLLETSTAIPIVGGGGKEGFQHIGIASPPALLASPKIFGAIVTGPAGPLFLSLGVWTPNDWTERYLPLGAFENGVNANFVALLPARIKGLQGFHSVSLFVTSRQALPGQNFPDIQPPPGIEFLPPVPPGGTHIKYALQQFLWQDPVNPRRGWGFFGHIGLSAGTPAILDWNMTAGVAGSVPIQSRPLDRFGIGYFRFSLTERVENGLAARLPVGDEQGVEIYYTAQLGKQIRLTANGQVIDPVVRGAPTAVYLGLRAKADF